MIRRILGTATALVGLCASVSAAAAPVAHEEWQSGFETGFPGEFFSYDDGSYSAKGSANSGKNEVWTIVDDSDPVVFAGSHAYRGWPVNAQTDVHRAYPVYQNDNGPGPIVVNSFMVYMDVDFSQMTSDEWVHVATFCNNPDWTVFTMSVRDRKIEMAHLDWNYIGPTPQPDFPQKKWVRITSYLNFKGAETTIHVWQDGTPIFDGSFTEVAGTRLMRAHWGWYSSGGVDQGVEYNDNIQVWSLSEPLTDLETEPTSPYGPTDTDGGGSGGSASAGAPNDGGRNGNNGGAGNAGGRAAMGGRGASMNGGASATAGAGGRFGGFGGSGMTGSSGAASATGGTTPAAGGTATGASGAAQTSGGFGASFGGSSGTQGGSSGAVSAPFRSPPPDQEAGCSCRLESSSVAAGSLWPALSALGLALVRRRRAAGRVRKAP